MQQHTSSLVVANLNFIFQMRGKQGDDPSYVESLFSFDRRILLVLMMSKYRMISQRILNMLFQRDQRILKILKPSDLKLIINHFSGKYYHRNIFLLECSQKLRNESLRITKRTPLPVHQPQMKWRCKNRIPTVLGKRSKKCQQ